MAGLYVKPSFNEYLVDVMTTEGENLRIPISAVTPDRMDSAIMSQRSQSRQPGTVF